MNLNHIDSSKLYTSRVLQPRHLIGEPFLVTNVDMFIKIFYSELKIALPILHKNMLITRNDY